MTWPEPDGPSFVILAVPPDVVYADPLSIRSGPPPKPHATAPESPRSSSRATWGRAHHARRQGLLLLGLIYAHELYWRPCLNARAAGRPPGREPLFGYLSIAF
ncbi:hypothetical protein OG607_02540 [Streptomyces sp. NBC_01537]|uniref:hypothetical protein n=1 Tax=Streptomyces sp. NBC_01537 TaxID=2903896 RepID=UPI00386561AB